MPIVGGVGAQTEGIQKLPRGAASSRGEGGTFCIPGAWLSTHNLQFLHYLDF